MAVLNTSDGLQHTEHHGGVLEIPPLRIEPTVAAVIPLRFRLGGHERWVQWSADAVAGAGRAQQELVVAVQKLRRAWDELLATPREGGWRLRSNAAAWRALDLLPRHLVLTGLVVAAELGVPLKSAIAALRDLAAAGVLVEHVTAPPAGPGQPRRLYTSPERARARKIQSTSGVICRLRFACLRGMVPPVAALPSVPAGNVAHARRVSECRAG